MKNIFILLVGNIFGLPIEKSDTIFNNLTCRDRLVGCHCFSELMKVKVPGTKMNLPKNNEEKTAMNLHCEKQVQNFDEFVLVTLDPFQLYTD